jgi:hypothetical protein
MREEKALSNHIIPAVVYVVEVAMLWVKVFSHAPQLVSLQLAGLLVLGWELIFGSNFWDPHPKLNSDSISDSGYSGHFLKILLLKSHPIGVQICKIWNSGIPVIFSCRNSVHLIWKLYCIDSSACTIVQYV